MQGENSNWIQWEKFSTRAWFITGAGALGVPPLEFADVSWTM